MPLREWNLTITADDELFSEEEGCWICGSEEHPSEHHGDAEVFIQPSLHPMEDVYRTAMDWAEEYFSYSDDELVIALARFSEDEEDGQILDDFLDYDMPNLASEHGYVFVMEEDSMMLYRDLGSEG